MTALNGVTFVLNKYSSSDWKGENGIINWIPT